MALFEKKFNFKFYDVTTREKKTVTIHIFPSNMSTSKGNQTMQFVHLLEYNKRNISLKNHTQNVVGKLFSDPFLKNPN